MPSLKIRNTLLGEGRPKICVPIVGTTEKEILEEAGSFSACPSTWWNGAPTGSRR